MSEAYEENLDGVRVLRPAPSARHELICDRLHGAINACLGDKSATRLLMRRDPIELAPNFDVCPDLTLVTAATGKPWLLAEIVAAEDHRWDTVAKKQRYEELNFPRLWMVDLRYDNVEIYHGGRYGLGLQGILAGREALTEKLLPGLNLVMNDLFLEIATGSTEPAE